MQWNIFEIMIVTATLEQSTYYTPSWSATLFACFAKVLATHAMQLNVSLHIQLGMCAKTGIPGSMWIGMMTSSNGNIFRVTGHLCGEFTGHRWRPIAVKAHRALMFSLICTWINGWVNICEAGDLIHHRAHYDVTVMELEHVPLVFTERR